LKIEFITQTTVRLSSAREQCRLLSDNSSWNSDCLVTQLCLYLKLSNRDIKAYPSQYRRFGRLLEVSRSSL